MNSFFVTTTEVLQQSELWMIIVTYLYKIDPCEDIAVLYKLM